MKSQTMEKTSQKNTQIKLSPNPELPLHYPRLSQYAYVTRERKKDVYFSVRSDTTYQLVRLQLKYGRGFSSACERLKHIIPERWLRRESDSQDIGLICAIESDSIGLLYRVVQSINNLSLLWYVPQKIESHPILSKLYKYCIDSESLRKFVDNQREAVESSPLLKKCWSQNQYTLIRNLAQIVNRESLNVLNAYSEYHKLLPVMDARDFIADRFNELVHYYKRKQLSPTTTQPSYFAWVVSQISDEELCAGRYNLRRADVEAMLSTITTKILSVQWEGVYLRTEWFNKSWDSDFQTKYAKRKSEEIKSVLENNDLINRKTMPRSNLYYIGKNNPYYDYKQLLIQNQIASEPDLL